MCGYLNFKGEPVAIKQSMSQNPTVTLKHADIKKTAASKSSERPRATKNVAKRSEKKIETPSKQKPSGFLNQTSVPEAEVSEWGSKKGDRLRLLRQGNTVLHTINRIPWGGTIAVPFLEKPIQLKNTCPIDNQVSYQSSINNYLTRYCIQFDHIFLTFIVFIAANSIHLVQNGFQYA